MKIPTVRNVANPMKRMMTLPKRPGLGVTNAGDGSTMAARDLRGNHPRKQLLNAGSAKLKNKTNHKQHNTMLFN